ncbi:MAG: CpaF family protein [Lachnospiraceae bacterium]|nr:CpaF family protein [Lachnospiraceae bacterium]
MSRLTEEKARLSEELFVSLGGMGHLTDEEINSRIEEAIIKRCRQTYVSIEERRQLKKELFDVFRRLDVLSQFLEDEDISEIMINGSDKIFIEKRGELIRVEEAFSSEERLRNVIQQIVSGCNRIVNETVPIVDARLKDGSRVNIVLPPVALDGAVMTIRKFPKEFFTMERLIDMGSITAECASFLRSLVRAKYNIFISGGTGSGKTTFLNVLSNYIPKSDRVITIEDAAELQLHGLENLVRLETRNANVEGENEVTMSALIKTALRMRPTRIIVGEVRDAAAMDMANSMLTGHDGSLSTGHGNSAREMMLRLETMILMGYDMPVAAIRGQLAAAIDIVVHLGRLRDNSRKVLEVCEITGIKNGEICLNTIYEFVDEGMADGKVKGALKKTGSLINLDKLQRSGEEPDCEFCN